MFISMNLIMAILFGLFVCQLLEAINSLTIYGIAFLLGNILMFFANPIIGIIFFLLFGWMAILAILFGIMEGFEARRKKHLKSQLTS